MQLEPWDFGRGLLRVQIDDVHIAEKFARLKHFKQSGIYWCPDGRRGWYFIFPSRFENQARKLLGLPLKEKNKNRVLAGKNSKIGQKILRYDLAKVNSSNLGIRSMEKGKMYHSLFLN